MHMLEDLMFEGVAADGSHYDSHLLINAQALPNKYGLHSKNFL